MLSNNFQFIGRLTKDPIYYSGEGKKPFVTLSIAVERNKDEVDFIHLIAYNNTADFINSYITKGTLIAVEGKISFYREIEAIINGENKKISVPDFVIDEVKILSKPQTQSTTEEA